MHDISFAMNETTRRNALLAASAIVLDLWVPGAIRPLNAQTLWPQKPLRLIVVYPPGGLSDDMARAIAEKLAVRLEVPVRVENRAGSGGSIGMEVVAKAPPDGHTLAFSAISPLSLNPQLSKVNYDPFRDIAPVASIMYTPVMVVGTPGFPGQSFRDLLAAAKSAPGKIRWATSGSGTVGHMVLEHVRLASGVDLTHIPYKGGGQQLTDALAGHFEVLSTNVASTALQYVRSGKFKPLAVGAPARLGILPEVPTLAELGYPQANLTSLFGIFAPGKTPDPVIQRLNAEINAILRQPEFLERLAVVNNIPALGSASDFAIQIATESRNNARVIEAAHIKLQ